MGESRRHPRVWVSEVLEGKSPSVDGPLVVRDLSDGGFAIESYQRFVPGGRHRFHIQGPSALSVALDAVAIHSMRVEVHGKTAHITGFAFDRLTMDQRARLTVLLEELSVSA